MNIGFENCFCLYFMPPWHIINRIDDGFYITTELCSTDRPTIGAHSAGGWLVKAM